MLCRITCRWGYSINQYYGYLLSKCVLNVYMLSTESIVWLSKWILNPILVFNWWIRRWYYNKNPCSIALIQDFSLVRLLVLGDYRQRQCLVILLSAAFIILGWSLAMRYPSVWDITHDRFYTLLMSWGLTLHRYLVHFLCIIIINLTAMSVYGLTPSPLKHYSRSNLFHATTQAPTGLKRPLER